MAERDHNEEGLVPGLKTALPEAHDAGDEAWIGVIRKMDEVYSDLLQHQVALEEKNGELEQTQHFLHSVLDSMSDVLVVCDRYGRVVEVNRALVDLMGRSESALRGLRIVELFHDEASQGKAEALSQSREPVQDCEVSLLGRGGEGLPVAFNCSPRQDSHGRFVGMVMVGRPIGELRKAYRALREAHDELQATQQQLVHSEKMASLGRLVAGVAHELNNPISFVLGNVHALARYTQRLRTYVGALHDGDAAAAEALRGELRIDFILEDLDSLLDGAIEGAERTRDIVDDLKRFSVVDKEEPEPFELTEVVQRAVHWVSKASPTGFQVELDLPENLPTRGTAAHLQQVLINLIQNALDATAECAEPRLVIQGRHLGQAVELRFLDNGPGIPATDLPRVFDPFYTTKAVGHGTGLGLSISYGIVERHGGQLSAANRREGGAEFRLRLPAE